MDVGVILGGMIIKHVSDIETQNKLLERIDMRHIENDLEILVYDEYGDILDKKTKKSKQRIKRLTNSTNPTENTKTKSNN